MSSDAPITEIFWLEHGIGLPAPKAQTAGAAGADLHAAVPEGDALAIAPRTWATVPCGFALALPTGFEAQIRPRSGLAARFGVTVLNAPGTIDADYRGEIMVLLINHGTEDFLVRRGDRIAQLILAPVTALVLRTANSLEETKRGENGLGSTGFLAPR